MKPIHFLPPAVALVIAAAWLGSQRHSIATIEKHSVLLQKHIAAAREAVASENSVKTSVANPAFKKADPIDWKKLAAQLTEERSAGGMPDMRAMMRFQQRLMSMDKDELVAALDEISALDLPEESRAMLEQMLVAPLVEKDPEFALTRFIDRMHDEHSSLSWHLGQALGNWAKKDPVAATAWLDRQIAAGTFESKSLDGKSEPLQCFEGSLIMVLLSTDPAAAGARLTALPSDQRREVLRSNMSTIRPQDQLAYAQLVRQHLPEEEQAGMIASMINGISFHNDSYAKTAELIDRIKATPEERRACIEQAAETRIRQLSFQRPLTRDDIEELRAWTNTQSPDYTDQVTGKAFASAASMSVNGKRADFSELAKLAVDYHAASGSDEVLIPLLESWSATQAQNKEQARALAGKVSDEKRRKELLQRFAETSDNP